jgi:hypothetical protein
MTFIFSTTNATKPDEDASILSLNVRKIGYIIKHFPWNAAFQHEEDTSQGSPGVNGLSTKVLLAARLGWRQYLADLFPESVRIQSFDLHALLTVEASLSYIKTFR